ncbi:ABC transporter ATP-binding protein [Wenzhouxiangella limi]|uniref:ABC transporter ATP-binding protein n=1 Tax=Wenzhouxiangella limi TaxID=2707351 RepID=A0A845V8N7_9GAMM|nr:ABC transporter ATP-binding protein [Wenzhouxiangella limi]NDY96295.1 ABC transporter ATP-binding protein [Wenzhouxiangella limi]
MSNSFSSLITDYSRTLVHVTRRVGRCAPWSFLFSMPLVVINQVSFILMFMLPLKIIIMLGTEGIPRYMQFFVTQETRQAWIIYLSLGIVGFFILYLVSDLVLSRLGARGGARIRAQGNKATLFDAEEDFAKDVFSRVAQTWGTLLLVIGGVALGLLLEWRLVAVLMVAVILEIIFLARFWNRYQAPEQAEARDRFVQKRVDVLQNISAVNTFLAFGVLVFLFLTDPTMNFIIGLIMFILTRQVLQRMVKSTQDGYFMLQQRERIEALVYPEQHVREKRQAREVSFETLLMPDRRRDLFEEVARMGYPEMAHRQWQWCDFAVRGQALYVSSPQAEDQAELRLKVIGNAKDAGLAREVQFYQSSSAKALGLSAEFVGSGAVHGRGFLALRSGVLKACPGKDYPAKLRQVRLALWQHDLDKALAERLKRSFASLGDRLDAERFARIRLGCNEPEEEKLLDAFLDCLADMRHMVNAMPRVLINRNVAPANLLLTEQDQPVLINWDAIARDVMGVDLTVQDLDKAYNPDTLLPELAECGCPAAQASPQGFKLVVHLSNLEKIVAREAYRAALNALPPILVVLEEAGIQGLPDLKKAS